MGAIKSCSFKAGCRLSGCLIVCMLLLAGLPVPAQDHSHHQMTDEQFAELRDKVALYRELTDEQIMDNMSRMGPNFHVYLSDSETGGKIGVLALGHGYVPSGNEAFMNAYKPTAQQYPTAVGFGMAMMSSDHIQSAVDELTSAGADIVVVMPITTLKAGGLIGQWRYIFELQDEAPWMSVDPVQTSARVVFGPTPTTDPVISEILLDHAMELSQDPSNEAVALIAHGPDNAQANALELEILEQHASVIRSGAPFAKVRGFTLQDDAPSAIRQANIQRIRSWVQTAADNDQRVIVLTTLPVKGSVQKKIRRDLEGLDYALSEKGVVENPRFTDWIASVIASTTDQ
jgi:sirohydrochlorin ferrochelatase